jgi:PAS domain S-box-containing protein
VQFKTAGHIPPPQAAPAQSESIAGQGTFPTSSPFSHCAVLDAHRHPVPWAVAGSGAAKQDPSRIFIFAASMFFRCGAKKRAKETSVEAEAIGEKIVAEKQEEMELVLMGAQLGTWCWFVDSGEVEFNERCWAMLGYAADELPGQLVTWKELLHPDEAPLVTARLNAHLTGTTPFFSAEYRMRHKSGRWIWVHGSGKILQRRQGGKALRGFGVHLDITERKESARLLALAKEESDRIIRNFLDTLIVVDARLMVIRVNQATCELLGYCEQELIGRHITALFHDDAPLVHAAFAFYAEGRGWPLETREELRNIELCYRHKNGDRLPMSFNINLLKDETGAISGVLAGAKDVSNLRIALDKVAQQKEYIETLFDILPEGLLALSPSQQIIKSNRAYNNLLETWTARLGLSTQAFSELLLAMINEQQRKNNTFIIQVQLGKVKGWFRCNSIFISILEGVAAVVSIDDITNERQSDEERRLLATVVEQTSDAVFIVGADEIVRYVNPSASRSSGYSAEDLIGSPPPIYNSDLMDQGTLDFIRETVFNGDSWQGHFRNRRKDGSIIEEHTTIFPIRNDEGQLANAVAVKRDITEQVKLQQQLLQAQKLEAIGQLAAGIAHEINTPMQYIQNNVTFLEQSFNKIHELLVALEQTDRTSIPAATAVLLDNFDFGFFIDEISSSINETQNGVNRVVKIVAAMKEFSHPGGEERAPTDLNHALENTLIVCRNEWKYVAELVTDYCSDMPLAPCFADQLNQAILNLVINASHAIQQQQKADSRPGCIYVATRHDQDWAEIRIEDNGCGIPPEIRQHIYDPFFTTKEVGKGTGQGLAIAHDIIVKKHGGAIDFTTTLGEGTAFIIRLPLTATQLQ